MARARRSRTTAKERAQEKREMERRDIPLEFRGIPYKKRRGMSHAESAAHAYHENAEEIEAMRSAKAEAKARQMWKAENAIPTKKEYIRRGRQKLVRITVVREITRKSKHWGQEVIPF